MINIFSFRSKIFWLILLLAVAPLLAILSFGREEIEGALIVNQGVKFSEFANVTAQKIDQLLYARKTDLETFARDPEFATAVNLNNYDKISEQLRVWKRDYGVYAALYYINNEGKILAASESSAVGRKVNNESWYKQLSRPAEYAQTLIGKDDLKVNASVGDLAYDSLTATYSVNFSCALYSTSQNHIEQAGILVSRLNWSELYNLTSAVRVHEGIQDRRNYAVLIDAKGRLLSGPGFLLSAERRAKEAQVLFAKNYLEQGWSAARAALEGKKGYLVQRFSPLESLLVGYAPSKGYLDFPGLGWAVLVIQDTRDTFAVVERLYLVVLLVFVSMLVAAIFGSWALTAKIQQRFDVAYAFLDNLRKGYLKERVSLVSRDEFGVLATKLNQAGDAIEALYEGEKQARLKAETANNKKGLFLADLAEEIKTPINNALEMNDTLLQTQLNADQRSILTSMRKVLSVLMACANEMRDIARIETGQVSMDVKPFDLSAVIAEIVEIVAISAGHAGKQIVINYPPEVLKRFQSDAVRIHQLVTNLLSYVIKRTAQSSVYITVFQEELSANKAAIRIVIADRDYRQQKDKLKHLFQGTKDTDADLDHQVVSEELSTSKRLAELMGGEVGAVMTSTGGGSVVWLALLLELAGE